MNDNEKLTVAIGGAMNNTEPLPCPFCGYAPQVSSYEYHLPAGKVYGTQWKVECMNDNCPTQPVADWHYFTKEEAIAEWNRRA